MIGGELILIVELVGPIGAGVLGDAARRLDHVSRQLAGHPSAFAGNDREPRAQQPHMVELFAREGVRSEEHTSELQSLMRISYAVFCLKKKTDTNSNKITL